MQENGRANTGHQIALFATSPSHHADFKRPTPKSKRRDAPEQYNLFAPPRPTNVNAQAEQSERSQAAVMLDVGSSTRSVVVSEVESRGDGRIVDPGSARLIETLATRNGERTATDHEKPLEHEVGDVVKASGLVSAANNGPAHASSQLDGGTVCHRETEERVGEEEAGGDDEVGTNCVERLPMEDVDKLTKLIGLARVGAQDPLRKLRTLLIVKGYTLPFVANMSVNTLTDELESHVRSRNGSIVKNPRGKARTALKELTMYATLLPELNIPSPHFTPKQPLVEGLAVAEHPAAYRNDFAAWAQLNNLKRGEETTALSAIKDRTFRQYSKRPEQMLTIGKSLGLFVDETFGIRALTEKAVVEQLLEILEKTYSPGYTASFATALLRMARDLLGDDASHKLNIEFLECEVDRRIPNPELSAKEILALDDLSENKLFASTLRLAPKAIAERSRLPGLSSRDRLARLAAAFAWELKFSFPVLSGQMISIIDMAVDLRLKQGSIFFGIPDEREAGGISWEPLSAAALDLREEWETCRRRAEVTSTACHPRFPGA